MSISIAGLNSDAWFGLGKPDSAVIEIDDVHYETRKIVTLLTKQIRESDENQLLSTTNTFTPTASPYDITSLIGKATPAFVEILADGRWRPLRCVNVTDSQGYYDRGVNAASFYGEEDGTQYIIFSYPLTSASTATYRIRYDADAVATSIAVDDIQIPDSFQPYIVLEIQQPVIMKIRRSIAEAVDNQEMKELLQIKLETWADLYKENERQLETQWRPAWRTWKNRARTAQNQGRLPSRSGRGLYGG